MKIFSEEVDENFSFMEKGAGKDFNMDELALLKTAFMMIEKAIDDIELSNKSKTFEGSYIFRVLEKADVSMRKKK